MVPEIISKSVLCENPDSPFDYFGWPTVARLPDGTLAVTASGYRLAHVCPFGKAVICYSRDEGGTWTKPAAVIDTPLDDRDSGITSFGNGRVILTSFNNSIAFQRNANAQRHTSLHAAERVKARFIDAYLDYIEMTCGEIRHIGSGYCISEDGGITFGKVMRAHVTAPHGPFRLNDGSLMYVGRVYSENDAFENPNEDFIECWHMPADGHAFTKLSSVPNIRGPEGVLNSCEPHGVQLPDGRIIIHIRVQGGKEHPYFTVFQSESDDGGKTFSPPLQLLADRGGAPAHLLLHSGGTLISVYGYREQPYGIRVMLSRDGGKTWDKDLVLDAGGKDADLGYPATAELKDGSLMTVYYEHTDNGSRISKLNWRLKETE